MNEIMAKHLEDDPTAFQNAVRRIAKILQRSNLDDFRLEFPPQRSVWEQDLGIVIPLIPDFLEDTSALISYTSTKFVRDHGSRFSKIKSIRMTVDEDNWPTMFVHMWKLKPGEFR